MRPDSSGTVRSPSPFDIKIGTIGFGFGIGCGIGVGVGRSFQFSAIPAIGPALSGLTAGLGVLPQPFRSSLSSVFDRTRKAADAIGVKDLSAGMGCGVGLGYGYGAGLILKPSALRQLRSWVAQCTGTLTDQLLGIQQNIEHAGQRGVHADARDLPCQSPSTPQAALEPVDAHGARDAQLISTRDSQRPKSYHASTSGQWHSTDSHGAAHSTDGDTLHAILIDSEKLNGRLCNKLIDMDARLNELHRQHAVLQRRIALIEERSGAAG